MFGLLFSTHPTVSCGEVSDFSRLVAVRYLGGILELSTFWDNDIDERLLSVVDKLCEGIIHLIEDIDIDSDDPAVIDRRASADMEGIDIFACAVLAGVVDRVFPKLRLEGNSTHPFEPLLKLIQKLQRHIFLFHFRFPV